MKKSELIKKVAVDTEFDEESVEKILNSVLSIIAKTLKEKESVSVHGFGKFFTRHYSTRRCYNVKTGEMIEIKPSLQPAFSPGPKLRKTLNK